MKCSNAVTRLLAQKLEVIDVEQNTPEWLAIRRAKRTASETPIVLGISPWTSPGQLAIEKFSDAPIKLLDNAAVRHGHKYEPMARTHFEKQFGMRVIPSVVARGLYLSSLDGWARDRKQIVEIKCPYMLNQSDTWVKACDGEIPDHYYAQIQHQIMVSGAWICHFWVFDTKRRRGICIQVEPDKHFFARIISAWENFMKKYG